MSATPSLLQALRRTHQEVVEIGVLTIQHATEIEWDEKEDGWLHIRVKPGMNVKGWALTYDGRDYPTGDEKALAEELRDHEHTRNALATEQRWSASLLREITELKGRRYA